MAKFRSLTMATIGVRGPAHAAALLKAIEAGLRAGLCDPQIARWRQELMNMRWRAHLQQWSGWDDGGWSDRHG